MPHGRRGDILIVDDHEAIRAVLREILGEQDLEIREAADGATALSLARERPPDLVFLDLSMPGMDGMEVLRRLKADERTAGAAVVILTAHGDARGREGMELAAEYLEKPFSPLALLELVDRLLPPR